MNYTKTIQNLIECFKKLPGIGEKTAERLSLSILNQPDEIIDLFSDSIKNVKKRTKYCKECNGYSETDICQLCSDEQRDHTTLCVVEDPKNIIILEKVGTYKGMYYALGGLISPLNGITPNDIHIDGLLNKVEKDNIKEVIIAVKPSLEGETTSLYISQKLEQKKVIVSKIAHGIPLGADMDYIDPLTLEIALENRNKISSNIN